MKGSILLKIAAVIMAILMLVTLGVVIYMGM